MEEYNNFLSMQCIVCLTIPYDQINGRKWETFNRKKNFLILVIVIRVCLNDLTHI